MRPVGAALSRLQFVTKEENTHRNRRRERKKKEREQRERERNHHIMMMMMMSVCMSVCGLGWVGVDGGRRCTHNICIDGKLHLPCLWIWNGGYS